MTNHPECRKQKHVHELTGSTRIFQECEGCHNHRFCTVAGEAMPIPGKEDHFKELCNTECNTKSPPPVKRVARLAGYNPLTPDSVSRRPRLSLRSSHYCT